MKIQNRNPDSGKNILLCPKKKEISCASSVKNPPRHHNHLSFQIFPLPNRIYRPPFPVASLTAIFSQIDRSQFSNPFAPLSSWLAKLDQQVSSFPFCRMCGFAYSNLHLAAAAAHVFILPLPLH
jgi:hypothetical protein